MITLAIPTWQLHKIPTFACPTTCADCCGPHPWTPTETHVIHEWLAAHGRAPKTATGLHCPYLRPAPHRNRHPSALICRCSIYPVRPLICRLYGTLPQLLCPHGHQPTELLSPQQEAAIMQAYHKELTEQPLTVQPMRHQPPFFPS